MRITLCSSLHLDHGKLLLDQQPGDQPPMQSFVPIGLLSLKAAVKQAGVEADVRVTEINGLINRNVVLNNENFYENILDAFLAEDDDLAGLMTDADSLPHTILLAERIKRRSPRTKVCLGGPAASPISSLLLERFPFIDFVVRGEGEATFSELIQAMQGFRAMQEVAGITWRTKEKVFANSERPILDDLDALPFPELEAYGTNSDSALYLDVGRGCPFRCRFCATAPFWSRRYRMKSTQTILRQMKMAKEVLGRTHVNFSHDIFTCDRKWTLGFCRSLREAKLGMTWSCSTRTDIIDREVLENLAGAGCVEIYYGIETGSDTTQQTIDKGLDLNYSREIVATTADLGIRPVTGFITGHPTETLDSLGQTLEKFFEFLAIGKGRAHLFTLCPFHEAPMYKSFAPTIERPAEYADLPLPGASSSEWEELKQRNKDVFSSTFRYSTPNVPAKLIDATEEVSCHLVVLKSIWPLLLPHYDSALDWYCRWVNWIEEYNAQRRPASRLTHQGNAYDLLQFIKEELVRLDLASGILGDLVRYEEIKLAARGLPEPLPGSNLRQRLDRNIVIQSRCQYLATKVQYDMKALLTQESILKFPENQEMWVVVGRTGADYIDTLQMTAAGKQLLELVRVPQSVGQLRALFRLSGGGFHHGMQVLDDLCCRGWIGEATL